MTRLEDLAGEVLVVCPACSGRALVRRGDPHRLTCTACGHARERPAGHATWGVACDPWFDQPLWLRTNVRGHELWAFNAAHLDLLEAYVGARQRRRSPQRGAPMALVEKLPAWMTAAAARDDVLAGLRRLRAR